MTRERFALPIVLAALCLILLQQAAAPARDVVVTLTDGRQLTGALVAESDTSVTLLISGIRTNISREQIKDVQYRLSIQEQYRERRGKIADDNLDQRYDLARWLFYERAYDLAAAELDDLAKRFPTDARVAELKRQLDARLKLLREQGAAPAPPAPTPPATQPVAAPEPDPSPRVAGRHMFRPAERQTLLAQRLTDEQVNLIKVYEIELTSRPAVIVPREVLDTVFSKYADREEVPRGAAAQRFRSEPGWRQLQLLFDLKARELYPKVQVRQDPEIIRTFRNTIHRRYVLNYCGTSTCHGGKLAGDFFLYALDPQNDDQTVYTNFYILTQHEDQRGFMIDRERPERSYLLQYSLARGEAATPHPDVPGWRPQMFTLNDPGVRPLLDWIRSLGEPATRYPFTWTAPKPAQLPAAEATPEPR